MLIRFTFLQTCQLFQKYLEFQKCQLFIYAVLGVLVLTGCNAEVKVTDKDLVYIDTAEVVRLMTKGGGKQLCIVDSRSMLRYDAGHIEGAINLQAVNVVADDPKLKKFKSFIVYGREWDDPLAKVLSKRLIALKYKDVMTYRGGISDWLKEGNAIVPTAKEDN